jgi:hypothetical protein
MILCTEGDTMQIPCIEYKWNILPGEGKPLYISYLKSLIGDGRIRETEDSNSLSIFSGIKLRQMSTKKRVRYFWQ